MVFKTNKNLGEMRKHQISQQAGWQGSGMEASSNSQGVYMGSLKKTLKKKKTIKPINN